jgi:hypothetical protein
MILRKFESISSSDWDYDSILYQINAFLRDHGYDEKEVLQIEFNRLSDNLDFILEAIVFIKT